MDHHEISEFISVGNDYLWLDQVVQQSATKVIATKYIDPALPVLASHYLGFPLFPGSLQCEACFQASNVLLTRILPENPGHLPVIARVNRVKFKRLVRPGDTLTIQVDLLDRQSKAIYLRGRCSVDGQASTTLDFVATEVATPELENVRSAESP